jgi:hypothetical protein
MRRGFRRELLRYEVRVLGPWLFALPVAVACVFAATVAMMWFRQAHHSDIASVVMAGVEGAVPLMAGIGAATVVSYDPAMELQLAVPEVYRVTMLRRLALFLGWSSLVEVAAVAILAAFWPWTLAKSGLDGYLFTWLAPLLWFGAWGAALTLLLRSRAASVAILGVVWVVELLFHALLAAYGWTRALYVFATMFNAAESFWGSNRLELLATALTLFAVVWFYLHNSEWCLRGEESTPL